MNVVGITYHREALATIPVGPTNLELRCQPANPFDRNAVAVVVNEVQIGYLSAKMAKGYQPLIQRLASEGPVLANGMVIHDAQGKHAEINLPREERLSIWANTKPEDRHLVGFERLRIRIKRQRIYQSELHWILGRRHRREVRALVETIETAGGKYRPRTTGLKFTYNGLEFGLIPAQYRDLAEELFAEIEERGAQTHLVCVGCHDSGEAFAFMDYYPIPRGPTA